MIPQTFEQWKHCIEHDCKVKLTKEFAQKRLSIYQDNGKIEREKFKTLYGEKHLQNIIQWYNQILSS
jgi:hypothetical protein